MCLWFVFSSHTPGSFIINCPFDAKKNILFIQDTLHVQVQVYPPVLASFFFFSRIGPIPSEPQVRSWESNSAVLIWYRPSRGGSSGPTRFRRLFFVVYCEYKKELNQQRANDRKDFTHHPFERLTASPSVRLKYIVNPIIYFIFRSGAKTSAVGVVALVFLLAAWCGVDNPTVCWIFYSEKLTRMVRAVTLRLCCRAASCVHQHSLHHQRAASRRWARARRKMPAELTGKYSRRVAQNKEQRSFCYDRKQLWLDIFSFIDRIKVADCGRQSILLTCTWLNVDGRSALASSTRIHSTVVSRRDSTIQQQLRRWLFAF